MSRLLLTASIGLALGLGAGFAQAADAPAAQAVITKNATDAAAGTYRIDKNHASVIARIPHGGGFSISTIRFGVTDATLNWNPAAIEQSKLTVTVDMTPRYDPIVYGQDLKGTNFFNLAQFPTATFTSTAIRRTGPTTGTITGDLNFRGQTHPATIEASLVGAGKTARGVSTIGFTGVMKIKRSDWGMTFLVGPIGDNVEVVLDGEFSIPAA
jgi:polyisoprenoid-binding protein YceI